MAAEGLKVPWPHAPTHQLAERGAYFVTAATYDSAHHFRGRKRLAVLHRGLLTVARDFNWRLEAWAVFSNHYHFIGHSPEGLSDATSLGSMLSLLHERTAKWVNKLDAMSGRCVWYNYWDTHLTYERSYLARLNYVHQNPVRHGLVPLANQYPWCSAGWFERTASTAQIKTIYRFKTNQVNVWDEYEPPQNGRAGIVANTAVAVLECGGKRFSAPRRFLDGTGRSKGREYRQVR